jgi:hypothetical protein
MITKSKMTEKRTCEAAAALTKLTTKMTTGNKKKKKKYRHTQLFLEVILL